MSSPLKLKMMIDYDQKFETRFLVYIKKDDNLFIRRLDKTFSRLPNGSLKSYLGPQ
jgi:hypothetical protein